MAYTLEIHQEALQWMAMVRSQIKVNIVSEGDGLQPKIIVAVGANPCVNNQVYKFRMRGLGKKMLLQIS